MMNIQLGSSLESNSLILVNPGANRMSYPFLHFNEVLCPLSFCFNETKKMNIIF